MFQSSCALQLSFAPGGVSPARSGLSLLGRIAHLATAVNERTIVFAVASLGLAASTAIVLRALSQGV